MNGRIRTWTGLAAVGVMAVVVACLGGCDRYPQDSPEAVLSSARKMVEDGKADRLGRLLYAENDDVKRVYRQLGTTLGNLQDLGKEIQKAFPKEVEELRAQAEEAARSGKASSLIGQALIQGTQQARGGRRRGPQQDPTELRDAFDRTIKEIIADPYGWLERSEERLTVQRVADDTALLMWDGKPVLPPLGIALKEEKGKWYVVPPTNVLGAVPFMPRTKDEYDVWIRVMQVVDNMVVDLIKDVKGGKVRSIREVAEAAGEKAFIPMVLGMIAYGKMMDERQGR